MTPHGHLTWETIVLVVAILLVQGTWLFIDARKHSRWPWFWGLWGLIQAPVPTVVYLFTVRKLGRHLNRESQEL
jgi:hypothetical protein